MGILSRIWSKKSFSWENSAHDAWWILGIPVVAFRVGAPAICQRAINRALHKLKDVILPQLTIDDVLIFSHSKEDALYHLQQVLEALAGFLLNWNTHKFFKLSVEYLSFIFNVVPYFSSVMAYGTPLPSKTDVKWRSQDEHTKSCETIIKHLTGSSDKDFWHRLRDWSVHRCQLNKPYGAVIWYNFDIYFKVVYEYYS